MTKLSWGKLGDRHYEAGVDRGVFYPSMGPGVSWNGLVSVKEDVDENGQSVMYFDGERYLTRLDFTTFSASLGAITYPVEFESYDGYSHEGFSAQSRKTFGFSYRTLIGNPLEDLNFGYKIHIVYNALANPTQRENKSLSVDVNADMFEWNISTTPIAILDLRPSSHIILDSRMVLATSLSEIEDELYGTDITTPRLPSITEIMSIFEANAMYKIIDNGDGTWTAIGPDEAFNFIDSTTTDLTWPAINWVSPDSYQISSF